VISLKAVILAGGEGTRLRPLTDNIPKPLIPVAGRPCVEYAIRSLVVGGFREMVITTGYLSDKLIRKIGDGRRLGAHILYSFESTPAGTAGAVKMVSTFLEGPFITMSGDTVLDVDLKSIYRAHTESGADVTMAVTEVEDPTEYGVVQTDSDGFVMRFQEKPRKEEAFSRLINAGIYVINADAMELVPEGEQFDFSKNLFPELLRKGRSIATHRIGGIWLDIGRPADLHRANTVMVEANGKELDIRGCTVSGRMIVEEAPNAGNDVEIRGPCYIGKGVRLEDRITVISSCLYDGVRIGKETRVMDSLLLEEASVGRNCDIRNSILSPGSKIGDNVMLERSVIGEGVFIKGNSSLIGANVSPPR